MVLGVLLTPQVPLYLHGDICLVGNTSVTENRNAVNFILL